MDRNSVFGIHEWDLSLLKLRFMVGESGADKNDLSKLTRKWMYC